MSKIKARHQVEAVLWPISEEQMGWECSEGCCGGTLSEDLIYSECKEAAEQEIDVYHGPRIPRRSGK